MDLKLIKPKVKGKSDKYSWNLHKYLSNNKGSKVYYRKINSFSERENLYHSNTLTKYDVLIGTPHREGIIGASLLEILRKPPKMKYFFINAFNDYQEITDEFFKDYVEIGRCLFDSEHNGWMTGDENRFTYQNDNERICSWCKLRQQKEIKQVIKEYEVWS